MNSWQKFTIEMLNKLHKMEAGKDRKNFNCHVEKTNVNTRRGESPEICLIKQALKAGQ